MMYITTGLWMLMSFSGGGYGGYSLNVVDTFKTQASCVKMIEKIKNIQRTTANNLACIQKED